MIIKGLYTHRRRAMHLIKALLIGGLLLVLVPYLLSSTEDIERPTSRVPRRDSHEKDKREKQRIQKEEHQASQQEMKDKIDSGTLSDGDRRALRRKMKREAKQYDRKQAKETAGKKSREAQVKKDLEEHQKWQAKKDKEQVKKAKEQREKECPQRERIEFIKEMQRKGFWGESEVFGSLPSLFVTQLFLIQDEKVQNDLLQVVYAYWMCELDHFGDVFGGYPWDTMWIRIDNGTPHGRKVGTYNPFDGIRGL